MTQIRRFAAVLNPSLTRNSRLIDTDEQEAPVANLPAAYVIALSVVVLFPSAAWWAWLVSRGLTVTYTDGFRNIRLLEK